MRRRTDSAGGSARDADPVPPVPSCSRTPGQLIEVEAVQPETKDAQAGGHRSERVAGRESPFVEPGPSSSRLLIRVLTTTRWYVFPGCTGVSMFSQVVI
jgi:hypothetical protein